MRLETCNKLYSLCDRMYCCYCAAFYKSPHVIEDDDRIAREMGNIYEQLKDIIEDDLIGDAEDKVKMINGKCGCPCRQPNNFTQGLEYEGE